MPYGDGRGPEGMGPMSGRGMGYCAGYDRPGYMDDRHRCGRRGRRAFRRGMGMRRRAWDYDGYWVPAGPEYGAWGPEPGFQRPSHKEMLTNRANALRQELEAIEADLAEMEEGPEVGPSEE